MLIPTKVLHTELCFKEVQSINVSLNNVFLKHFIYLDGYNCVDSVINNPNEKNDGNRKILKHLKNETLGVAEKGERER